MAKEPFKHDRRRYPRAITDFSAVLSVGPRQYAARVINLSVGGALLDLPRVAPYPPIAVGDRLSLIIRCRGGAGPLCVEGRAVLWNLKTGKDPLLAVQFDELGDETAEVLEDLLAEALSEIRARRLLMS